MTSCSKWSHFNDPFQLLKSWQFCILRTELVVGFAAFSCRTVSLKIWHDSSTSFCCGTHLPLVQQGCQTRRRNERNVLIWLNRCWTPDWQMLHLGLDLCWEPSWLQTTDPNTLDHIAASYTGVVRCALHWFEIWFSCLVSLNSYFGICIDKLTSE